MDVQPSIALKMSAAKKNPVAKKRNVVKKVHAINVNENINMDKIELSERYRIAYNKTLEQEPFWKKDVIINNTGQRDRIVDEFCQKVIEMAESDTSLN